jgi:two-component system sensor histidine kinase KdpD
MQDAIDDGCMNEIAMIRAARRNLRWLRWGWLSAALAAYIVWDIVDQAVLISFNPILGGFGIDWSVIALLVIMLTLIISYGQDRQLAQLKEQIARTMTAERTVLRLEAAQAQARADALAASERLKSTLLAAVSHDYRTPLASIIAAADELLAENVDWTPEVVRDFAGVIRTEAERLTQLGANLLDLTRIEAGVLRPQLGWYNIAEIINRVLDRFTSDLTERPLELDVPDNLPLLPVDYVQIEQVLWNIIQNALKYSSPGTALTIMAASDGAAVLMSVGDRGPGIPPTERSRVFEPFYRLHQATGVLVAGAGIGLAICKGLIESHGGGIAILDRNGGGTLVQIRLPLQPAEISADQGA